MLADVNAKLPSLSPKEKRPAGADLPPATPPTYDPAYPAGPRLYPGYLPGSPSLANSSASGRVERLLSFALRFFPRLTCLRTRRFQVLRVLEAISPGLLPGRA